MSPIHPIKYCQQCGHRTAQLIPTQEHRLRAVCKQCGFIHYQNPCIVAGVLAVDSGGAILLAKRDIEPRRHFWTLPAGFLELGESLEQGALRETEEETHCKVKLQKLLSIISLPQAGQVHMFFSATLVSFSSQPTHESSEVQRFAPDEVPWSMLAFKTVKYTLTHYFQSPQHLLSGMIDTHGELKV